MRLLTVFALFVAIAAKADVPCEVEFDGGKGEAQIKSYIQKLYKHNNITTKSGGIVEVNDKVFNYLKDQSNGKMRTQPGGGKKHQVVRFDASGNASTKTEMLASGTKVLQVKIKDAWHTVGVEDDCKWLAVADDLQKSDSPELTEEQLKQLEEARKKDEEFLKTLQAKNPGATIVYSPNYNFNNSNANNTNSGNSGSGAGGGSGVGTPKKYVLVNPRGQMAEVDYATVSRMNPAWTSYSGCVGCQQATLQNGYMLYGMNPQMYRAQLVNLRTGSGANVVGGIIAPISSEIRNWLYFAGLGAGGGGSHVRYGNPNPGPGPGPGGGRHWVGGFRRF